MVTTSLVPEELVEQLERGNVIPLLGADLAQGDDGEGGLPSQRDLAQELARRSGYKESDLTLSRVAQYYDLQQQRHALISFLREQLIDARAEPLAIHRLLATHSWRFVVTTSLDDLFERALFSSQRPFATIIGNTDVAYQDQEKLLLVRMYGSLDQPDSVVVTELDYLRWQHQIENFMILLQGLFASRTLLILGHDLEDEHIRNLYGRVILPFNRNVRRSYAVSLQASSYTKALWEQLNVQIIPSKPIVFMQELLERLLKRHHARYISEASGPTGAPSLPPTPIPRQPYKFLNSYEASDSSIFFGRDNEKAQILSKIVSFRLILLHGKSGTGKTSLIKAGLMPELGERGYAVTYARILMNPIESIETAFNNMLDLPFPKDVSLHDFLVKALAASKGTDVLFLDQFEQLFSEQFDAVARQELLTALGEVYADTSLDLKLVIAIREDALAELSALKQQIPEIFYNDFHLELLSAEAARQAIVNPVIPYGIRYEEELVDRILKDLGGENVDPPQLQIVCDHLYAERGLQAKVITHAQYDHLGGARSILTVYLDRVLNQYPGAERAKLQTLLKEFITSGARPAVPTLQALAQRTGLSLVEVQQALDELEQARLIRELPPEPRFELVHEYLIQQISSWTNEQDQAQKRAQEMLEQGLLRWQNFHLFLYEDELAIVNTQREKLRLNDEENSLLVHSAVWTGAGVEYWLDQSTPALRLEAIQAALVDSQAERRQRAAMLVSRYAVSELVLSLQYLVENDPVPEVWREAIIALQRLEGNRIIPWLSEMLDGPINRRERALEAISELQEANNLEIFGKDQLAHNNLRLKLAMVRLRRNRQQWSTLAIYALVGGFLGGTLAGYLSTGEFRWAGAAGLIGLVSGYSIGMGYGVAKAVRERRNAMIYLATTMLGGAVGGFVVGLGGYDSALKPSENLFLLAAGTLGGTMSGIAVASIVSLTIGVISSMRRLMIRLSLSIPAGLVTLGAMLILFMKSHSLEGLGSFGGLLTGVLIFCGIVLALHSGERQLEQIKEIERQRSKKNTENYQQDLKRSST